MKKVHIILALSLLSIALHAQDNLGIAGSTRAPVNTLWNNPSTIVDSRAFIDIQLAGFSVYAKNDLVFLHGNQLSIANFDTMTTVPLRKQNTSYSAFADVQINGPSVTFAYKQHAFGISTSTRVMTDVRGIPSKAYEWAKYGFDNKNEIGKLNTISNVRTNALAWGELGLTYGTIIARRGYSITQGAITVKKLYGIGGAGVRLDSWTYMVQEGGRIQTKELIGQYGFNDPTAGILNGQGWGADIGITYKVRLNHSDGYVPHSPCTDGDYRYRIGVSLLDVGRIKFKEPFYTNNFSQNQSSMWENYQGTQADNLGDVDSLINNNFDLIKQNGYQTKFTMMLPTALSVQGDLNLISHLYLYGVATYGVPWLNQLGVQRSGYIGIAPRWETKRFEASLPLSMYQYKRPQLGLCLRLNSIVIGSDDLAAILFKKDVYGADFYFSLKYTIFKNPKCGAEPKREKYARKVSTKLAQPCPAW